MHSLVLLGLFRMTEMTHFLPFQILYPHKRVILDQFSSFLEFFFMFFTLHEEVLSRETLKETMFVLTGL